MKRRYRRKSPANNAGPLGLLVLLVIGGIWLSGVLIWLTLHIGRTALSVLRWSLAAWKAHRAHQALPVWKRVELPPPQLPAWPLPTPPAELTATTTYATGRAFENHCAKVLTASGWTVTHMGGSGDFGCDLIARRASRRIAIQCKAHQKPVGTRAVQEAHSGRGYHRTTEAAVLAPNGFTPNAIEIGRRLNVRLLTARQIASL